MKYALIFPNLDGADRVVDTAQAPFPVAQPLFWLECPDEVEGGTHVLTENGFEKVAE